MNEWDSNSSPFITVRELPLNFDLCLHYQFSVHKGTGKLWYYPSQLMFCTDVPFSVCCTYKSVCTSIQIGIYICWFILIPVFALERECIHFKSNSVSNAGLELCWHFAPGKLSGEEGVGLVAGSLIRCRGGWGICTYLNNCNSGKCSIRPLLFSYYGYFVSISEEN